MGAVITSHEHNDDEDGDGDDDDDDGCVMLSVVRSCVGASGAGDGCTLCTDSQYHL